jgi:bifunctional non-homologous end joining protein LigD
VTLVYFDLLSFDGLDATSLPLRDRRGLLESLALTGRHWQLSPWYDDGETLLSATEAQGLEGVVSKKLSSCYHPGQRCEEWLKFPHRPSGSYVVGGWRFETGSATRLGALLVGEPTPEGLVYRGRVGSGVTGRAAARLMTELEPLHTRTAPFVGEVPREDAVGTVWVRPSVVVEVASLGLTPQARLRQPSYLGMRADLRPDDLIDLGGGEDG